jgi:hypothetical protein
VICYLICFGAQHIFHTEHSPFVCYYSAARTPPMQIHSCDVQYDDFNTSISEVYLIMRAGSGIKFFRLMILTQKLNHQVIYPFGFAR